MPPLQYKLPCIPAHFSAADETRPTCLLLRGNQPKGCCWIGLPFCGNPSGTSSAAACIWQRASYIHEDRFGFEYLSIRVECIQVVERQMFNEMGSVGWDVRGLCRFGCGSCRRIPMCVLCGKMRTCMMPKVQGVLVMGDGSWSRFQRFITVTVSSDACPSQK